MSETGWIVAMFGLLAMLTFIGGGVGCYLYMKGMSLCNPERTRQLELELKILEKKSQGSNNIEQV